MPTSNQIDIVIPEEVITAVTTKLQEIKTALRLTFLHLRNSSAKPLQKWATKHWRW